MFPGIHYPVAGFPLPTDWLIPSCQVSSQGHIIKEVLQNFPWKRGTPQLLLLTPAHSLPTTFALIKICPIPFVCLFIICFYSVVYKARENKEMLLFYAQNNAWHTENKNTFEIIKKCLIWIGTVFK